MRLEIIAASASVGHSLFPNVAGVRSHTAVDRTPWGLELVEQHARHPLQRLHVHVGAAGRAGLSTAREHDRHGVRAPGEAAQPLTRQGTRKP